MDEMPTMKEWRRVAAEGKLEGPQKIFFAPRKPIEELYDTLADPHEINNLAADPAHAAELSRLRGVHESWREVVGDLGLTPEADLMARFRPGGQMIETTEPTISLRDGRASMSCTTDGASIAYRLGAPEPAGQWLLYAGPVAMASGQAIEAKACRLGFKDSATVVGNAR